MHFFRYSLVASPIASSSLSFCFDWRSCSILNKFFASDITEGFTNATSKSVATSWSFPCRRCSTGSSHWNGRLTFEVSWFRKRAILFSLSVAFEPISVLKNCSRGPPIVPASDLCIWACSAIRLVHASKSVWQHSLSQPGTFADSAVYSLNASYARYDQPFLQRWSQLACALFSCYVEQVTGAALNVYVGVDSLDVGSNSVEMTQHHWDIVWAKAEAVVPN